MDKRFERLLVFLMAMSFIFLFIIGTYNHAEGRTESLENQYPGILRFHVIANSDTASDQNLKLKVRNYVLERLQEDLSDEMLLAKESMGKDFDEAIVMRRYIKNNLEKIQEWALQSLRLENSKYGCSVSIGVRHIPAKYYDDIFFPEGNYEALTITIGEGKGQNWWCVVFPPLCLVENDDSSYRSKLDMEDSDKIQLKSKILEIMKESTERNKSTSISDILKGIFA